ncbi:MAG: J domain-containing protein [Thermodesulfobacteriota bacterium]
MAAVVEQELFQACQVIFGDDLNISTEFLEYVQMSGVKSAYRKRAKETHPDTLVGLGERAQLRGSQQFQAVQQAYKNLSAYLDAREKGFVHVIRPHSLKESAPHRKAWTNRSARTDFSKKQAKARQQKKQAKGPCFHGGKYSKPRPTHRGTQGNLFTGRLPDRPLLFGHFLYYSGLVDWQSIIKALVWQRSNRPRLGDIGRRFGWLTPEDVVSILKTPDGRPFGKRAVEKGLLTPRQLRTLLAFQKSQQSRIGEYFVRKRIIDRVHFDEILGKYHAHNQKQNKKLRKAS